MRKFALALTGAALFALPTAAFSQSVVVGPGGVQIEPYYHGHHYARSIHGGGQCRDCVLLACTKKSWANKVRETANGIAKCARNKLRHSLPTSRFMHDVENSAEEPGRYLCSGQGDRFRPERCRLSGAYGSQGDWLSWDRT